MCVSCAAFPYQVWQSEVVVSPTSPRALTDDLPTFSLSPLPYITEVTAGVLHCHHPDTTSPFTVNPFLYADTPYAHMHACTHAHTTLHYTHTLPRLVTTC